MFNSFALYTLQTRTIFWCWVITKPVLAGKFYTYNDACSYAFNCLGHESSDTFFVKEII